MRPEPALPPPPPFRPAAIRRTAETILGEAAYTRLYVHASGTALTDIVEAVHAALRGKVPRSVVFPSVLASFGGRTVTEAMWDRFAWRMAGNLGRLKAGLPLPPEPVLEHPGWVPLRVLDHAAATRRDGAPAVAYTFRAMAGPMATATLTHQWSRRAWPALAVRLGFSRRGRGPYVTRDPAELVNLWLMAWLDPDLERRRYAWRSITVTPVMRDHNRDLLAIRFRKVPCPQGRDHPCLACPVGYQGPGGCPAALRPASLEDAPHD